MVNKDYHARSGMSCGCGRSGSTRSSQMQENTAQRYSCGCGGRDGRGKAWMRRLKMVDFALQELVLYLDMYPDCRRALDKYHALREEREKLLRALEDSGIAVTAMNNNSREHWDWADAPWPWEYEFLGNAED